MSERTSIDSAVSFARATQAGFFADDVIGERLRTIRVSCSRFDAEMEFHAHYASAWAQDPLDAIRVSHMWARIRDELSRHEWND